MRRGIKGEGRTPCANAYDYGGADELEQAQRDHKTASAAHDEIVLAGWEMSGLGICRAGFAFNEIWLCF